MFFTDVKNISLISIVSFPNIILTYITLKSILEWIYFQIFMYPSMICNVLYRKLIFALYQDLRSQQISILLSGKKGSELGSSLLRSVPHLVCGLKDARSLGWGHQFPWELSNCGSREPCPRYRSITFPEFHQNEMKEKFYCKITTVIGLYVHLPFNLHIDPSR